MTYVQYINCSKWKKVVGISLWTGLTIALIYYIVTVSYGVYNDQYKITQCSGGGYDIVKDKFTDEVCKVVVDYGHITVDVILFGLGNMINWIMIWRTLNKHYQWLEIRCGVKPSPNEVKHD